MIFNIFLKKDLIVITSTLPPQTSIKHFELGFIEILLFKIGTKHAAADGSGTIFNLSIINFGEFIISDSDTRIISSTNLFTYSSVIFPEKGAARYQQ